MQPPAPPPLSLDASREVLARAAELIAAAWRSFDRYRSEEPPLVEIVREVGGRLAG